MWLPIGSHMLSIDADYVTVKCRVCFIHNVHLVIFDSWPGLSSGFPQLQLKLDVGPLVWAVGLQLYLETRGRARVWRGYLEEPSAGVEVEGGMEALAGVDNQPPPPLLAPKLNTVFQNLPPQPLTPQLLCNAHLPQLKHPTQLRLSVAEVF